MTRDESAIASRHCLLPALMPELPELEVVREVLQRRVVGQTIVGVEVIPPGGPIVVRDLTHAGFAETLTGATFTHVIRRGKFLTFSPSVQDRGRRSQV